MRLIRAHSKVISKGPRFVVFVIATSLFATAVAQITPQEKPSPQEEEVVRIDTNLVQVDAVVTDAKGRPVTDLGAEDFEILEDGRPQQVVNFSYISAGDSHKANNKQPSSPDNKDAQASPPTVLNRESVRRTLVLVVDDMGISFAELNAVRSALKYFIDQQIQPGDLAAIVTTSGSGDLSRLTADKQILRAAAAGLRWQALNNRVGLHGVEPATSDGFLEPLATGGSFYGTLSSLEYVVAGLKDLPGRKSVVLFTEDFPIIECKFGEASYGIDPLIQRLLDKLLLSSNQASVVIHAIDVHGLATVNPGAADTNPTADTTARSGRSVNPALKPMNSAEWITSSINRKMNSLCSTQQSLQYVTHQTGGLAILNTNDFSGAVGKILDDLSGYYLIGYRPAADTFKKKNGRAVYHHLTVRVKRHGLTCRSRDGFFGEIEKPLSASARPMEQQLINAINSPFSQGGVRLRLAGLFGNGRSGTFIRVLLHVDARDLTFIEKSDGWREAVINVLANSYGPEGSVTDHLSRTDTVRARGATFANLMRNGLDYDLMIGARKAGAYQLRAALRDAATARIGTAAQFIEVPDVNRGMTISGIVLSDADQAIDFSRIFLTNVIQPVATLKISHGAADDPDIQPIPAVRRFRLGMMLDYRYFIYNARISDSQVLPELSAEIRLFRDGKLVMSTRDAPLEDGPLQLDPKRLSAQGELLLKRDLEPGQYVLQIVITNDLPRGRDVTASQTIDFEIVK